MRMDTTTSPRPRPIQNQLLPPPRSTPAATRRQRRRHAVGAGPSRNTRRARTPQRPSRLTLARQFTWRPRGALPPVCSTPLPDLDRVLNRPTDDDRVTTLQAVELRVLGPLQVRQHGLPVSIPGAKPRAILTMLGLHAGAVVSADALVELLWG